MNEGRIKAVWIMATNPAVSLPDAGTVRAALEKCPFVVVSDVIAQTDTGAYADVRLPAAAWGEKDGTVTNSVRTISRQRPFLPLPGEARPDWWIMSEVAARMGWASAFSYDTPADIWREHARLTAYQNEGARVLNLSAQATLTNRAYEAMEPFVWGGQPFADGRFSTPMAAPASCLCARWTCKAPCPTGR
jgi:assimilatory nitrate reductase catalytic subunit